MTSNQTLGIDNQTSFWTSDILRFRPPKVVISDLRLGPKRDLRYSEKRPVLCFLGRDQKETDLLMIPTINLSEKVLLLDQKESTFGHILEPKRRSVLHTFGGPEGGQ